MSTQLSSNDAAERMWAAPFRHSISQQPSKHRRGGANRSVSPFPLCPALSGEISTPAFWETFLRTPFARSAAPSSTESGWRISSPPFSAPTNRCHLGASICSLRTRMGGKTPCESTSHGRWHVGKDYCKAMLTPTDRPVHRQQDRGAMLRPEIWLSD